VRYARKFCQFVEKARQRGAFRSRALMRALYLFPGYAFAIVAIHDLLKEKLHGFIQNAPNFRVQFVELMGFEINYEIVRKCIEYRLFYRYSC